MQNTTINYVYLELMACKNVILCMVALTTGVVAGGFAWGLLQAGPLTGIFSHEFGAEGGTGPIC